MSLVKISLSLSLIKYYTFCCSVVLVALMLSKLYFNFNQVGKQHFEVFLLKQITYLFITQSSI